MAATVLYVLVLGPYPKPSENKNDLINNTTILVIRSGATLYLVGGTVAAEGMLEALTYLASGRFQSKKSITIKRNSKNMLVQYTHQKGSSHIGRCQVLGIRPSVKGFTLSR